MQLSAHFTLAELTRSETALRKGIDNRPPEIVVANLRLLCAAVLEPVRTLLGVPMRITSGYRSVALNKAVGGSASSAHMRGDAADFEPIGMEMREAFDRIRTSDIPFDQLIEECGPTGWIHIGVARKGEQPRRQAMLATGKAGAWSYYPAPPLEPAA